MRRLGILTVALAMAALPALGQQRVDEKKSAAKDGVVEIRNVAGLVRVTGWDREEVAVTGTLGKGTERLEFSASGNRTLVRVVIPHDSRHVEDSDLEISVPVGSSLEVETVSANITAGGVNGDVQLKSVSGDVALAGNPRKFGAKTVSGNIEVTAENAPGRAKSVSGIVRLRGVSGSVEAGSVSGDISVTGGTVSSAGLETTSGNITFDAGLAKDARVEAKSISGEVELRLPAGVAADFDVTTFSGEIKNELGPPAHRTSEYGPGMELSFTTGTGGARIVAKSFSGSVYLKKR
ncbi:MAG TPA: DUF4097 family beta strand repeat-containing protein [Thermoanaerobaculaceae bacterium]|nr:DUF4097 family beta strand repeat-containing protein [Thermoanaerobaculaceae bacterium]